MKENQLSYCITEAQLCPIPISRAVNAGYNSGLVQIKQCNIFTKLLPFYAVYSRDERVRIPEIRQIRISRIRTRIRACRIPRPESGSERRNPKPREMSDLSRGFACPLLAPPLWLPLAGISSTCLVGRNDSQEGLRRT